MQFIPDLHDKDTCTSVQTAKCKFAFSLYICMNILILTKMYLYLYFEILKKKYLYLYFDIP